MNMECDSLGVARRTKGHRSSTLTFLARRLERERREIPGKTDDERRICVVGSGWHFTSGISYYTCCLANAVAEQHKVSVILMRRLLPRRLYPGWRRVGQFRAEMKYSAEISVYDGVDWWWGLSLVRGLSFLISQKPNILVLQWWTATVLHSYLAIALAGRLLGTRVVIELHELQDTGEGRFPLVRWYGRSGLKLLLSLSHGCVTHSRVDAKALGDQYKLRGLKVSTTPHGPFYQYAHDVCSAKPHMQNLSAVTRAPRPSCLNLLFFGTIRPYKGLENLLRVFNCLSAEEVSGLWLTIIGETWEGCVRPAELIERSPYRERITFVNDYVSDDVVSAAFRHADVVVLPYRRSSSSGPLHVAMNYGLPVVVSRVGGLPEAASGYEGVVFVPPNDLHALKEGIWKAVNLAGQRYDDPRRWTDSVKAVVSAAGAR